MFGIFKEKSLASMTRVVILIVTVGILAVLLSVAYHIFYTTNHPVRAIEWFALAGFMTAIAGLVGVVLWGKKINKAEENKENDPV